MSKFQDILQGGDLRSIGRANDVVAEIKSQDEFDELFLGLRSSDRKVVMRTADAIEKVTLHKAEYLQKHKREIMDIFQIAKNIELKWHLALLIPRLSLTENELDKTWDILTKWAKDRDESKIVRVNSIQALFNLLKHRPGLLQGFNLALNKIQKENIPSINARIKKIRKTRD